MTSRIIAGVLSLLSFVSTLHGAGGEVVVIYNTRLPDSKRVAEHYAEMRQVPASQILGFSLPITEEMTRTDFREKLEQPLAKALTKKKLFRFGSETLPPADGKPGREIRKSVEAKIRYAVLCYGVPSRIEADAGLLEPEAEKMPVELRRNEAAVDSELANLPWLEQKLPLAGPLRNPVYALTNAALLHPTNGILMVTRLDGPTADIAIRLVDKAMAAERDGLWGRAYFDIRSITNADYKLGDDWIRGAEEISRRMGFETVMEENAGTLPASFPLSQVALYAGWYDETVSGPFARPVVEFMPGAFAYHLHSFSAGTIRSATRNWVGPLLAKGVTATMGCVYEPYLTGTPDISVFFGRFLYFGFTFGEAAYAALGQISWQTTVIGDPLYCPFGKSPREMHEALIARHSPLIEWSHLRVVNLGLAKGRPVAEAVSYLNQTEVTKTSAVLSEKLGDLYTKQGKPSSAVFEYEQALKLNPSPQQRVRLRLELADKLTALSRDDDAFVNFQKLLDESPDYPDKSSIYRKLLPLAQKLGKKEDAEKYQREIN